MIVADGSPELRETSYDLDAALEELRAADFPDVEEQLDGRCSTRRSGLGGGVLRARSRTRRASGRAAEPG